MKKLTKKEFSAYSTSSPTKKGQNAVIQAVLKLKVGQALEIDYSDWKLKTPFDVMLGKYRKRSEKDWTSRKTASGWIVLRIKPRR